MALTPSIQFHSSHSAQRAGSLTDIGVVVALLLLLSAAAGAGHARADGPFSGPDLDGPSLATDISDAFSGRPFRFGGFCPLRYDLPGDIRLSLPAVDGQMALDRYSWKTFLALAAPAVGQRVSRHGDNPTQWDQWSSTVDLIQCNLDPQSCVCPDGDCAASHPRYYPPECQEVEGFANYRVLDQFSKVDDSFLESSQGANGTPRGGLGNSPLVDAHGNFVRYEILISPVAYDYVVENNLYERSGQISHEGPIMFPCGEASYAGGDPADPRIGAYNVKNAWMEVPATADGRANSRHGHRRVDGVHGKFDDPGRGDRNDYHIEKLLVYTPSYRNSTGVASCELKSMALVGQHIMHKTTKQPRWIWSTYEHRSTAPDCTELPPGGDMMGSGPSKACPESVSQSYLFYPETCSADGSDPEACQTCNTPVASNFEGCTNPNVPSDRVSFCLDQPPAAVAGTSKTCRQVSVADHYPTAHRLNQACARRLGKRSVWSNYELISTMWFNAPNRECRTIQNVPGIPRLVQRPLVPIRGEMPVGPRPFLANATMETDVRSDCLGCHSAASVTGQLPPPGTDFNFWLQLEVGGEGGRGLGH